MKPDRALLGILAIMIGLAMLDWWGERPPLDGGPADRAGAADQSGPMRAGTMDGRIAAAVDPAPQAPSGRDPIASDPAHPRSMPTLQADAPASRSAARSLEDVLSDLDAVRLVERSLPSSALATVLGAHLGREEVKYVHQTITHVCAVWMRRLIAFQQGMEMDQASVDATVDAQLIMSLMPEMARLIADKQLVLRVTTDGSLTNVPYGELKQTGIFFTLVEPDVYRFHLSQGQWGIRIEGAVTLFPHDLVAKKESILMRRYGKK